MYDDVAYLKSICETEDVTQYVIFDISIHDKDNIEFIVDNDKKSIIIPSVKLFCH